MKPSTSSPSACPACDRQTASDVDVRPVQIPIKKGDVRRASRAADGIYGAAQGPQGPENGVVLMSAILLVERLAAAHQCDPRAVLRTIEHCFQRKAELMHRPGHCN